MGAVGWSYRGRGGCRRDGTPLYPLPPRADLGPKRAVLGPIECRFLSTGATTGRTAVRDPTDPPPKTPLFYAAPIYPFLTPKRCHPFRKTPIKSWGDAALWVSGGGTRMCSLRRGLNEALPVPLISEGLMSCCGAGRGCGVLPSDSGSSYRGLWGGPIGLWGGWRGGGSTGWPYKVMGVMLEGGGSMG